MAGTRAGAQGGQEDRPKATGSRENAGKGGGAGREQEKKVKIGEAVMYFMKTAKYRNKQKKKEMNKMEYLRRKLRTEEKAKKEATKSKAKKTEAKKPETRKARSKKAEAILRMVNKKVPKVNKPKGK